MKDSDFQLNVALGSGGPAVYVNSEFIAEGGFYLHALHAYISFHLIALRSFTFHIGFVIQVEDNT